MVLVDSLSRQILSAHFRHLLVELQGKSVSRLNKSSLFYFILGFLGMVLDIYVQGLLTVPYKTEAGVNGFLAINCTFC